MNVRHTGDEIAKTEPDADRQEYRQRWLSEDLRREGERWNMGGHVDSFTPFWNDSLAHQSTASLVHHAYSQDLEVLLILYGDNGSEG